DGLEFLLGALGFPAGGIEFAVDELDRLEEPAGGLGLPDFAEAAAAEPFDQPITRNRLGVALDSDRHEHVLVRRLAARRGRGADGPQPPRLALYARGRCPHAGCGDTPHVTIAPRGAGRKWRCVRGSGLKLSAPPRRMGRMFALSLKQPWAALLV